jgi:beta-galactosidase
LLEICDRLGMMVKEEAFDAWEVAKVPYDYHLHFAEWAETEINAMVRRDRNHPSVIMWSIGNEILHPTVEAARKVKTWVCEEDSSRPVTWASNGMAGREHQTVTDLLDLAGYNYGVQFYDDDHKKYPQRKIFGSETGAARHQRGLFLRPAWHVFYPSHPDLGSGYDNYLSK